MLRAGQLMDVARSGNQRILKIDKLHPSIDILRVVLRATREFGVSLSEIAIPVDECAIVVTFVARCDFQITWNVLLRLGLALY